MRADPSLAVNLARLQARGILAAYIDPMSNVLSRNDLFANALTCIDDIGSIPATPGACYTHAAPTPVEAPTSCH